MKLRSLCHLSCIAIIALTYAGTIGAADGPTLTVTRSNLEGFAATVDSPAPVLAPTTTVEGAFLNLGWPDAPAAGEVGEPAIPVLRRLFAAPPGAAVELHWTAGAPTTIELSKGDLPWRVMPVQPPVPKLPGARENAAFQFNPDAYAGKAGAQDRVILSELGLVRGERVYLLEARPVAYDPEAKKLVWWSSLELSVSFGSADQAAPRRPLQPGLRGNVINPEVLPLTPDRGTGQYLIVVDSGFEATIGPFAAAKTAQGFTVTTHVIDGDSNSSIKSWIQSQWDAGTTYDYLLLVGDTDTVPHWTGSGNGSPNTDLYYGCMDGAGDYLADIAVGRFSARTTAQLQAIIDKTLYVEDGPIADPEYLKRAVFMAGSDNYSITEGTHNYCIDNHMDTNGYTSDRVFTVSEGAGTQDTRDSFNAGRGYGIYSGHGSTTSWADGPPFSQSDVNGLTNVGMYPMVWSFACITGSYALDECFTETWSRAAGKGAVTIYGSSVNSYWTEDDILQRRLFDVIFDNTDAVPTEIGPVWVATDLLFVAHFGTPAPGNDELRYLEMYNLLGDPSLRLPGKCSDTGTVILDRGAYSCDGSVGIAVADCGLNLDDNTIDTVAVLVTSTTENVAEQVILTETDAASADFRGTISVSTSDAVGVLQVAEGDIITVAYVDADDGQGGSNVIVSATATVDCTPPNISNIRTTSVEARSAVVEFDADEPVIGHVHYGPSCDNLDKSASSTALAAAVQVSLNSLAHSHTYFYAVEAEDAAGLTVSDDNDGSCYSFDTLVLPDFYTEMFEASDNDLANLSINFQPSGSGDFYHACSANVTELPIDPSGGTTILSTADDEAALVSLNDGKTVSIYGQSYSSFYVCSNGHITFGVSDTDYSESIEDHFDTPRISMLFDDLEPRDGGTVSYKQLEDRIVVSFVDILEYSYDTPNPNPPNTFQVEMHFDGTIVLSYVELGAADGLAGLSAGQGVDEEFVESDLSTFAECKFGLFSDGFELGNCSAWSYEAPSAP